MKLSELVYQCVKNVAFNDDTSFSFENFLEGNFDGDADYATHINNAFIAVNEAIARLSDLERIPYRVEECEIEDRIIELSKLDKEVKEVVNVAQAFISGCNKIPHRPFGINRVYVTDYNPLSLTYIEYKEDIPFFTKSNIKYETNDETFEFDDNSVDLKTYGITNSMCNYIIEYVMGKLFEPSSVEIANMHLSRAETYFMNIRPTTSAFVQKTVTATYRVGE